MTSGQPGPDEPGTPPTEQWGPPEQSGRPEQWGPPEHADQADQTREMPRPSPWARESGDAYGQQWGQPPQDAYGQQWGQPQDAYGQQWGAAPAGYGQPPAAPYAQPQAGPYGQPPAVPYGQPAPWTSPGAPGGYGPGWGGPAAPPPGPNRRRRAGLIAGAVVLVLAAGGGITAAVLAGSDDSGTPSAGPSAPVTSPAPGPSSGPSTSVPTPTPTPSPSASPQLPLVPTPAGLRALGYRAYSVQELTPAAVAIDSAELRQFQRYGLSRVVMLRALTIGTSATRSDDWDAGVTVLTFRDASAAEAELEYSNTQNKKDGETIALPGLPDVTAFVNETSSGGTGVSAFTTTGRYQVVVSVRGLTGNTASARSVAAEAARVLKAVLPSAPAIAQLDAPSGGGGSGFPTPTPSGTRA